jgi:hypothetical protein
VDKPRQHTHDAALREMQRRGFWDGSFNGRECTIQQLSPYIGKLKSGMVRTWEFRWADLKEDHIIADTVFSQFQQRMRDFVTEAHAIMLSDAEVTRAIS